MNYWVGGRPDGFLAGRKGVSNYCVEAIIHRFFLLIRIGFKIVRGTISDSATFVLHCNPDGGDGFVLPNTAVLYAVWYAKGLSIQFANVGAYSYSGYRSGRPQCQPQC